MKVAVLDGTPKSKESRTRYLIDFILANLDEAHINDNIKMIKKNMWREYFDTIVRSETIILVSPLYVDGLPSHVLDFLYHFEKYLKENNITKLNMVMYFVINCGFYEGFQNKIALKIIDNWCLRTGIVKGQGIGIGAGTLQATNLKIPFINKSKKTMKKILEDFCGAIEHKEVHEEIYHTPQISRKLCMQLSDVYWYGCAFQNRIKFKDLYFKRK